MWRSVVPAAALVSGGLFRKEADRSRTHTQGDNTFRVLNPFQTSHSIAGAAQTLGIPNPEQRPPHGPLKIFSGNAHAGLAHQICDELSVPLGAAKVRPFKNGETNVIIEESVRDCDVYVVQPTCNPTPNEYLMEVLLLIDGMRRGGAARITAVLPIYGYARQDKKDRSRAPITAKLVADMIGLAGADRVITVDLHASQIQGMANYPIDNLYALQLFEDHVKANMEIPFDELVVVSPDAGGAKRAEALCGHINADLAIFSKKRERANEVSKMILTGDVRGKTCLIVDDMADTAGTLCLAAKQLLDHGAKEVYAAVTHGVLSDPALDRIMKSPIKELLVTDTIPQEQNQQKCPKIRILRTAPLLARAINYVHTGYSLGSLFPLKQKSKQMHAIDDGKLFHD